MPITDSSYHTGFEEKPLRVVIENWLYNTSDITVLMDATTELRRRLSKTFERPAWAQAFGSNANGVYSSNEQR